MKILTEEQMEKLLISKGFNIFDSENCIDSVLVSDFAIDYLGFEGDMNQNGQITFTKNEREKIS